MTNDKTKSPKRDAYAMTRSINAYVARQSRDAERVLSATRAEYASACNVLERELRARERAALASESRYTRAQRERVIALESRIALTLARLNALATLSRVASEARARII